MTILNRYLYRSIIEAIGMVGFLMAGILLFIGLVSELEVLSGQYNLWQACGYVLAQLPYQLLGLSPLVVLVGTLLGLGLLAKTGELLAMQIVGMQLSRLMGAVLRLSVVLGFSIVLLGEMVSSVWLHQAENKKLHLMASGQALRILHGIWIKDKRDYIYIGDYDGTQTIQQVMRFHFNEQYALTAVSQAQRGVLHDNHWMMQQVQTHHLDMEHITTDKQAEQIWSLKVPPSVFLLTKINPEELTLTELYAYMREQASHETQSGIYALVFWQRMFQPLQVILMMLLAVPCVLGPLRASGLGFKIIVGIVMGLGCFMLNRLFGFASLVLQISPLWGMFVSLCLWMGLLCYWLRVAR